MLIHEFEDAVWKVDGIFVVVRGNRNSPVGKYDYKRALPGSKTIMALRSGRIEPLLNGHEYVILDGYLETPHGKTSISSVRKSYY